MPDTKADRSVRRILVVDDNTAIHDDFKKILCPTGAQNDLIDLEADLFGIEGIPKIHAQDYQIDSAFQGQEALELITKAIAKNQPYDLAFVDMRMPPGWDGVETIERIWSVLPDIEIVICTAYSDYSWSEIVDRLGFSDNLLILKKPFDSVEVCQLAAALTRKRELARQAGIRSDQLRDLVDRKTDNLKCEIEERQKLEGRLLQAQKLEAVGQLAAGIAHEINTPAQFVGDNIRFLQDSFSDMKDILEICRELNQSSDGDRDPQQAASIISKLSDAAEQADIEFISEEVPSAAAQAIDGIKRISEIVKAMKEFSHPGNTEKSSVDLNQAIRSTITIAKNEWKYVANVVTELDESLPPVTCYPGELNQVVLNIVVNAAHAIGDVREDESAAKGTITVSTKKIDDDVEIRIRDTGGGIPEEIRNRVFEPFFTTKDVGKGTGQGLAIAHDVVTHKHDGTLEIESRMGEGTTFVIKIPLAAKIEDTEMDSQPPVSDGVQCNA